MTFKMVFGLAFVSLGASAGSTHISDIHKIQCSMNSDFCQIVLPSAVNTASGCTGNQVLVEVSQQQTLSVLASAMFTKTKVKFHVSEECVQGSPVVQSYQMLKG
ncbi:hypothetical protein HC752_15820 [Vibrio sp. S9_S30]|uniref:hypothetical protein n=1 Tax=Vibrio sp. S9_S30 TaxID=2720226 RepID=UPI001681A9C5|nr:hypothetical protein [Vibrio sp. S9_S30]MBD1558403.1 hypothetical protein [Vibrio sp. S9_S30]